MLPNIELLFHQFEIRVLKVNGNSQQKAFKTLKKGWVIAEKRMERFEQEDDDRIKALFSKRFKLIAGYIYSYDAKNDKVYSSGIGWLKVDIEIKRKEEAEKQLERLGYYEQPKTDKQLVNKALESASDEKLKEILHIVNSH